MAGKPTFFDQDSAERIADVVRQFEPPVRDTSGRPIRHPVDRLLFAKITGSTGTGPTKHSWTQQRRTSTGWEDAPSGLSGTTTVNYAIAPDGSQIANDTYVTLIVESLVDGSAETYTIVASASAPAASGFWAMISTATQDGTNKRWSYVFWELTKVSTGYAGFGAKSGGIYDIARNSIEYGNVAAPTTWHNGVNSANLTGALTIVPVPASTVVWMIPTKLSDGSTEYWFSFENAIDGSC